MRRFPVRCSLSVLAISIVLTSLARGEDWPKSRGPRGDNISQETGLAQEWPADGPKKLWAQRVGLGYSSPVAVDGKVYVFGLVDKKEMLTCLDAASGKQVW